MNWDERIQRALGELSDATGRRRAWLEGYVAALVQCRDDLRRVSRTFKAVQ